MIDSRDLYKPIVTPFELELALAPYVVATTHCYSLTLAHSPRLLLTTAAKNGQESTQPTFETSSKACRYDWRSRLWSSSTPDID